MTEMKDVLGQLMVGVACFPLATRIYMFSVTQNGLEFQINASQPL